jgi:ABC-2 type transport system permease protein
MKKIPIIIKREYLRRVGKKSFIIMTLLTPFLMAALVFVPLWLSMLKSDEVKVVEVIDHVGKYGGAFRDTDAFRFVVGTDGTDGDTDSIVRNNTIGAVRNNSIGGGGVFARLEIREDLMKNPMGASLTSDKQIPQDLKREVNRVLSQCLENEKRASYNIPNLDEIIAKSQVSYEIQTIKRDSGGRASVSSSEIAMVIGFVFTFMIYMFIMLYGAMVMQGVMEEKTNRIVEVMVSSVRPFDLMFGKIVGIGLVGLTQVCIWVVMTFLLVLVGGIVFGLSGGGGMSAADIAAIKEAGMQQQAIAAMSGDVGNAFAADVFARLSSFNFLEIIVCFVLYFIGGYISYASLYAAAGAAVDNPEDSQQFITPIMLFLIFAVYAGIYSVQNPDGPLAFWCSFLPFTSPIVMMVRIPFDVPWWQIGLSLVLSYATAGLLVWVSAKVYRVGILMYGKKPTFREIGRWIRR